MAKPRGVAKSGCFLPSTVRNLSLHAPDSSCAGKIRTEKWIKAMTKWDRTKLDLETILFCKWVSTQTVHNRYFWVWPNKTKRSIQRRESKVVWWQHWSTRRVKIFSSYFKTVSDFCDGTKKKVWSSVLGGPPCFLPMVSSSSRSWWVIFVQKDKN